MIRRLPTTLLLDMNFFTCGQAPVTPPPHVEDAEIEAAFDEVKPEKHKGKKHRKAQMPLDHS